MCIRISLFKAYVTKAINKPILYSFNNMFSEFFIIKAAPYFPPGIAQSIF